MNSEERVLRYLREEGCITSWRAIAEFGLTRLSSTIHRLRRAGYPIETEIVTGKNRYGDKITYAKYTLRDQE